MTLWREEPGLCTARSRAQNIGLREFPVSREWTTLQLYAYAVETTKPDVEGTLAGWRDLEAWRAFEGRRFLEPDEPVEEQLLIELPENIALLAPPSCSPELNPVERWFQDCRRALSNGIVGSISSLQAALTDALEPCWRGPFRLQT